MRGMKCSALEEKGNDIKRITVNYSGFLIKKLSINALNEIKGIKGMRRMKIST
jgi:hypothetical protein